MTIPHWTEDELPPEPCARIVEDSISQEGRRVTTFEMKFHRFILAEVNTHTLFSRNSASSRAIPLRSKKAGVRRGTLDRLEDEGPAYPVSWPQEQPGMQGADAEICQAASAKLIWEDAFRDTLHAAEKLNHMGLHKSVINRLLEPFNWHTAVITAESWEGFFRQRSWNHTKDAQPEFATVATMVEDLYRASHPKLVLPGQWHTPYIRSDEKEAFDSFKTCRISSARCARVSYLSHTGERDYSADLELYERLSGNEPPHASPLQHVAAPDRNNEMEYEIDPILFGLQGPIHRMTVPIVGNYRGWMQFRHIVMGF